MGMDLSACSRVNHLMKTLTPCFPHTFVAYKGAGKLTEVFPI